MMKLRMVPALLLAVALGACNDDILNVLPVDEISEDIAIVDYQSASAALAGAYSSLQSGSLYGGNWILWVDILTDDVEHTGTFGSWADGNLHNFRPQMGSIDGIWTQSYGGINRVNLLIQKVPGKPTASEPFTTSTWSEPGATCRWCWCRLRRWRRQRW